MNRCHIAFANLLVILGISASPSYAAAWCQSYNVDQTSPGVCQTQGVPLAWRRPCIGYGIDARAGFDIDFDQLSNIARTSIEKWTSVDCGGDSVGLSVLPWEEPTLCNKAEFDQQGRNVNTIAFVSEWSSNANPQEQSFDPGAIALTIVWFPANGEIVDADILINENQGPFVICPPTGCENSQLLGADLESVLTHEAGHFFGLAHSEDETSTMVATYPRGSIDNRTLEQDDIDGMCTIYQPGSVPGQCDYEPATGLSLTCEGSKLVGSCAITPGLEQTDHRPLVVLLACLVVLIPHAKRLR